MTASPSISIAMATCQGARFIDAQLESILAQSRPPDELVVCDDASTDDTLAHVEAFAARAPFPVRAIRNPARLGITKNFEQAVAQASGQIILLADQDDEWLPEKIDTLCAALDASPQVGVVFSNGEVVDEAGRALGYDLWSALGFDAREQASVDAGRAASVFLRHVVAAGTTMAFRSSFRPLVLPFPDLYSVHDAWIAFMIAARADCLALAQPLIRYRLHEGNQIGIRRFDLRGQLEQARLQIERRAFAASAEFFEQARARLAGAAGPPLDTALAEAIDAKIAHARTRDEMPGALLGRLPAIAGEALRGRYQRYSYGVRSIAQDIWLR
jgi:glycosyltransferase involved in cell wall biosynthesis